MDAGEVLESFMAFAPYSGGNADDRSRLTVEGINHVFPALKALLLAQGIPTAGLIKVLRLADTEQDAACAAKAKERFDFYGSDKSSMHDYHFLYGNILNKIGSAKVIIEIGLGTPNSTIVSNMGVRGVPGASLRAFRDLFPQAMVYGADIDRQILFEEDRIKTFFVDQTDPASLSVLGSNVPSRVDLLIDDGLHAPYANIYTLQFGLPRLRVGGWLVIEDISPAALAVWECVSALLARRFVPAIVEARGGLLFVVERRL